MFLSNELQNNGLPQQPGKRNGPVWEGPERNTPNGGITFSLLSRWLCCRERFRLYAVEGLAPPATFNHRIEYGSMWHLLEESYAKQGRIDTGPLYAYVRQLCKRYPMQQDQVSHWMRVCLTQFPIYVDYWHQNEDKTWHSYSPTKRKPLLQEQVFNSAYRLPSGRTVYLRGKWDSVDLVNGSIWLQENKTKGDVDEARITRQLRFDLQTMLYLVALQSESNNHFINVKANISGVRYNVVRRPLSGGRHTIKRHEPTKKNPLGESADAFYQRLGGLIRDEPAYFFMRWNVEISPDDVQRFRRTCLDPILEQLCDWWTYVSQGPIFPERNVSIEGKNSYLNFVFPQGVYNPTLEGNGSDMDSYLETGSTVGLRRVETLFPEL